MRNKLLIIACLLLSACGSQYSHRMVRVKKQKTAVSSHHSPSVKKSEYVAEKHEQVMPQLYKDSLQNRLSTARPLLSMETFVADSTDVQARNNKSQSKEVVYDDPPSDDFVRRKYQQANNLAVAALIFLGLSVFLVVFGLIIALILSIIAFRIYRKYDNPGVPERYVMAKTVLIISAALLALIAFLVGAFFYIILFL